MVVNASIYLSHVDAIPGRLPAYQASPLVVDQQVLVATLAYHRLLIWCNSFMAASGTEQNMLIILAFNGLR